MKLPSELCLYLLILSIILIPSMKQGSSISTTPLFVLGGSQGSEEGTQFVEPEGVAFSEEGLIFCSDVDNDRIQVYFSNGTYSHNITGFQWVNGVAIGPDGLVRAVDMNNRSVRTFYQNGTFLYQFGEVGTGDGQFQEPQGIGIDQNTGELYVSDSIENTIQKFTSEGVFLLKFGGAYLDGPESILITNELVYVCSETTGTIEVFDTEGLHKSSFGLGEFTDDPEGITVDPLGHILVNNEGKGLISIFDPNGTHIIDWGVGTGSGVGEPNYADGLAYDYYRHRLAVADQGNYRVLVFDWYDALVELGLFADSTAPVIDPQMGTISFKPGDRRILTWTISDEGLSGNYSLVFNSNDLGLVVFQEGYWKSNIPISITLPMWMAEETLTYQFVVFDRAGNSATDSGDLIVQYETVESSTTSDTSISSTPLTSPFVFISSLGALLIISTLWKKRK